MNTLFNDLAKFGNLNTTQKETRAVINNLSVVGEEVEKLKDFYSQSKIFSKCTYISNHINDTKVPYIKDGAVDWRQVGNSVDFAVDGLSSKSFKNHRITTSVEVSRMLIKQNDGFDLQLKAVLLKALEEKLIETILSESQGSEEKPQGILYNITPKNINNISDILDMKYDLDKKKNDNLCLILSPKVQKFLVNLDYRILNNDLLFGSDYICENKLRDGYIIYLDLSKLVITQFGESEIIFDGYSKAINGNYLISLNSYFDFGYLDNDFIKIGLIQD